MNNRKQEIRDVAMNAVLKGRQGIGKCYLGDNKIVTDARQMRKHLFSGKSVTCPNANSHHYTDFYPKCAGFDEVKVLDWSSSAGDWSFGVKIAGLWYLAWQENRHPYHGFRYYVADGGFPTFKQLANRGTKF